MPEGHVLHRMARDLAALAGQRVAASSPQGRFAAGAALVDGLRLEASEAYGKHLLERFEGGRTVHVHLGLAGRLVPAADPALAPMPQVRLRLAGDGAAWDLIAPSTCEVLDGAGVGTLLARLGPDPLRGDADPERAWARLRAGRGAIGAALLDQSVIAGVGNVFRAEALFACGLDPARPAASLTRPEFDRLWATTRAMMRHSFEAGRIVTFVDPPAGDASRDGAWNVYKRDDCLRCGAPVASWTLGGRTMYACPVDQPAA
jgi:formamidopyrimidine-DNA glycosylase